jgi:hypothetical protein
MTPPFRRFTVWAGNTLDFGLLVQSEGGAPFDLTGSEMVFRAAVNDYVLRKTSADADSGMTIDAPAEGRARLHLTVEPRRAPMNRSPNPAYCRRPLRSI